MSSDSLMPGGWVLLSYRMPREPSSPRVAVWRRLQRLGVAQLADGLVALPADARTREHFDWIAAEVLQAGGLATVWLGHPSSRQQERNIAQAMTEDRRQEYVALIQEAQQAQTLADPERGRAVKRLRGQLHKIGRRDYFPPLERDVAVTAVGELARTDAVVGAARAVGDRGEVGNEARGARGPGRLRLADPPAHRPGP
ncbi:Chromate resistance protein ChrB [Arthrobacter sp. A5]|uniref:Chromate resistance protein ChrB n=1 Tax=Arthrobacter sp. A5 TaxID=576926 RepID=UPI003DA9712E